VRRVTTKREFSNISEMRTDAPDSQSADPASFMEHSLSSRPAQAWSNGQTSFRGLSRSNHGQPVGIIDSLLRSNRDFESSPKSAGMVRDVSAPAVSKIQAFHAVS
jgi:hypothetical protein